MRWIESALGPWVVRNRWAAIAVTLATAAVCAYGVRNLEVSHDMRVFFGPQNPQLRALEALENTYRREQNAFFAVAPRDGDVFTRHNLEAVAWLTEECWQFPFSSRVISLVNFQHTRAEDDELVVEDFIGDVAELSDEDIKRKRQTALSDPLLLHRLVSASGHVTGVNVDLLLPGESLQEVPYAVAFAREMADEFRRRYPNIDVYLSGSIMIDNAFGEASRRDLTGLAPIMVATLTVLVGVSLRSVYGTLATLAVILLSMVCAVGLAGWFGITLNAASVGAPTLVLTLAVADSVHILATMLYLMRHGKTKHEAIAESMRINLQAVFLTSITTAVGFLTMNFSEAPPFRDLGNIVAVGVTVAFLYSVIFLPALVAVLPLRRSIPRGPTHVRAMDRLANLVIRRRRMVFWGTLLMAVLTGTGVARIELDDNFLTYFDDTYEFRRATNFILENLSGWDILEYSLESGESGGINEPNYIAAVEDFANWFRGQDRVVYAACFADIMKKLNQNMHADDPQFYSIPERRDLAAQYLLLYEMSLPFGHDLNDRINVDKSSTRMTVILESMSAKELRRIERRAADWLADNAPTLASRATGLSLIWAHITQRNIRSMLGASFMALVLISAILLVALRSVRLGLLSLVPNLLPPVMAFGIWGYAVGQVGLALSVIVSMTIGIVVDDTVHFLSKYLRAVREQHASPAKAVRYAFHTVGTAMWVTSLALVAGFGVLTTSHYRMSSDMGTMCAIIIALALVMDFLLLPTLLMHLGDKPAKVPPRRTV